MKLNEPCVIHDYLPSDPIPDVFGHETLAQYRERVLRHRKAQANTVGVTVGVEKSKPT